MDLVLDILKDAVVDTAKLIPFLFVTYLAMEALEHGTAGSTERIVRDAGKAGPVLGALLGAVPQCGFSAMAATLFSGRVVTAGTLVAVILSTSDEMLPVFLASQAPMGTLGSILACKVAIGMGVGLVLDAVLRATHRAGDGRAHIHELCEREHCHCEDDDLDEGVVAGGADASHADDHDTDLVGCEACHTHHHGSRHAVLLGALHHTVQVTAFIFVITIALSALVALVGEDAFAAFVGTHPVRSVFVVALVGLIPNCAASVLISELFLAGTIGTGAMLAGLLVSGGVGLLVLYRTNDDARENVSLTAFIYAVGVIAGLIFTALGIVL